MNRNDPVKRYKSARGNLLAMIVLTVVNIGLSVAGSGSGFLFRAFLPELAIGFFGDIAPWAGFAIAALLLGLYMLCWALSKKEPVWMTAALVLFAMDTAVFLLFFAVICLGGEFAFGMLLEVAFQVWVLYYLITGVMAAKDMRDIPEEVPEEEVPEVEMGTYLCPAPEAIPLREPSAKRRMILQHQTPGGLDIELARARGVTELIAGGMVCAEFRGIVEPAYELAARVQGHDIRATMDISALMELYVDGTRVGKKRRLI